MNKKKIIGIVLISIGAIYAILSLVFLFKNMSLSDAYDNYLGGMERDYEGSFLGAGQLFTSNLLFGLVILFLGLYLLLSKEIKKAYVYVSTCLLGAIFAFEGTYYVLKFASKVISKNLDTIEKLNDGKIDKALSKALAITEYPKPASFAILGLLGALVCGYSLFGIILNKEELK